MKVSEILSLARDVLQDRETPYRYDDALLLRGLNAALRETRRLRPDLLLALLPNPLPTYGSSDTEETPPIPEEYHTALADFVVGYAEAGEDEFTQDGRAALFMQRFILAMKGR